MILSTPHCHSTFVDGRSTAEEMVISALEHGFVSLGFSEHAPEYRGSVSLPMEDYPRYIAEVRRLQKAYEGRIRIHLGIEKDRVAYADRKDFDYILAANHYLTRSPDDILYPSVADNAAADGSLAEILGWREKYYGGNGEKLARDFFLRSGRYCLSQKPDIFAHFDLIKKQNRNGEIYDPDDPGVRDAAFEALDMVFASGAMLEVNTGGMARSNQPRPYPDPVYLKRWRELGGRVIVGSDCHRAHQIAFAFDTVGEYMRAAGFRTAWRLGGFGEDLFVEYPLEGV